MSKPEPSSRAKRRGAPARSESPGQLVSARVLIAALSLPALASVSACEPEGLEVRISRVGASRILASCEPSSSACPTHAELNPLGSAPPAAAALQLILLTQNGEVKQRSECVRTGLSTDGAQLATLLNDAVGRAIPEGISYEDFEQPSDATLMLLMYATAEDQVVCQAGSLVACSTFGIVETGSTVYDVQCAACAGGSRQGNGCLASSNCVFGVCDAACAFDICAELAQL